MHDIAIGQFKHEGYSLGYEQYGSQDAPVVVLVHGILLDSAVNRSLAETLSAEGYRVVLLDLLGHGRSDKTDHASDLRVDAFAEQLLGLMDHLAIERAVVGGLSLGAITALQFACLHPKRVRGLFLEMPVMEQSTPFAALLLTPIMLMMQFAAPVYRPFARLLRRLPKPRQGLWESVFNAAAQEPETIKAILHGTLVGPVAPPRRERRKIQVPTLIIGHGGDWLHNEQDARELANEIPNSKLLVAESILELRTRPQRLMPDIIRFVHAATGRQPAAHADASPARAPGEAGAIAEQFEDCVQKVRNAPKNGGLKPSNELKLRMYALYRQASDGDVQGKRPGITDPVGRFKYDAWATLKGTEQAEAMQRYVAEVQTLESQAG